MVTRERSGGVVAVDDRKPCRCAHCGGCSNATAAGTAIRRPRSPEHWCNFTLVGPPGKIDPAEVTAALREVWDRVDTGAAWFSRRELERAEAMLVNFREWLRVSRTDLTEFGVEADIDAVPPPENSDGESGAGRTAIATIPR